MRGLTVIGTAGFDPVVRADRDVEDLDAVPVEVANQQVKVPSGFGYQPS